MTKTFFIFTRKVSSPRTHIVFLICLGVFVSPVYSGEVFQGLSRMFPSFLNENKGHAVVKFSFESTIEPTVGSVVRGKNCKNCTLVLDLNSSSHRLIFRDMSNPTGVDLQPSRLTNETYSVYKQLYVWHKDKRYLEKEGFAGDTLIQDADFTNGKVYYPFIYTPLLASSRHLEMFEPFPQFLKSAITSGSDIQTNGSKKSITVNDGHTTQLLDIITTDSKLPVSWLFVAKQEDVQRFSISTNVEYDLKDPKMPRKIIFEKRDPQKLRSRQEIIVHSIEYFDNPYEPKWTQGIEILASKGNVDDQRLKRSTYQDNPVDLINLLQAREDE